MGQTDGAIQAARERTLDRYLAIWQGEAELDELDGLVTEEYVGHIGSRRRSLDELKSDIGAYRAATGAVRFQVEHRFAEGDHVATRLTAHSVDPVDGSELIAAGLNISRWEDDRLAEEWAVWEPFPRRK